MHKPKSPLRGSSSRLTFELGRHCYNLAYNELIYASSPSNRAHFYRQKSPFLAGGGRNHRHCTYPRRDGQAEWPKYRGGPGTPANPSTVQIGLDVAQLCFDVTTR